MDFQSFFLSFILFEFEFSQVPGRVETIVVASDCNRMFACEDVHAFFVENR